MKNLRLFTICTWWVVDMFWGYNLNKLFRKRCKFNCLQKKILNEKRMKRLVSIK